MFSFKTPKRSRFRTAAAALIVTAALALFCACSNAPAGNSSSDYGSTAEGSSVADVPSGTESSDASSVREPATLEQELLKQRGIPFESSDYKKLICDDGVIDINSEFDCNVDHGYSTGINDIVVSGGKVYFANLNTTLANGKNVMEVGALPEGGSVRYWHYTYDGEMGNMYFGSGNGYKVSCAPLSSSLLDPAQDPLFEKVYIYASDGKTLEDHTAEFLNAEKVYDTGIPKITFAGGRVYLLFSAEYLDPDTTEWNWYRSMGRRQYIAFELDVSAMGDEKPIRLFNKNILMTDSAFYEIVYLSKWLDDKDAKAQLAPDGTVSPYYPAAQHLNCNLGLRKISLLTQYYDDVLNITTSHVITKDKTLLPIKDIITEGYTKYIQYSCNSYGKAYEE